MPAASPRMGSQFRENLRGSSGQISEPLRDPRQLSARQAGESVIGRHVEKPAGYARITVRIHAAASGALDDRWHDGLVVAGGRESPNPDRADGLELLGSGRANR